jgi:D-cysteine desulfhydrase
VQELPRLSRLLGGPRILMKRDDLTGLAFGGNKTRKLEYLVGEALAQGCDTLVTAGAQQSNHCRQAAAAARACGLSCHLLLGGSLPASPDGNLLLDRILGVEVTFAGNSRKGEMIPEAVQEVKARGGRPYVIPYGGSNATGAVGFVRAAIELRDQLGKQIEALSHVVFASSSGGTQAGLMVGKSHLEAEFELWGIGIDKGEPGEGPFEELVSNLANEIARLLGLGTRFVSSEVIVNPNYVGAGYGVVGDLEREAIRLTARTEGILLDPVYTGRAMGGLIDLIRGRQLRKGDTVLFWHTGGTPALFPYREDLAPGL